MEKLEYSLKGLQRARKRKGMTQEKLAAVLGVHVKTVRNWEQALVNPELTTIMELSKLLDCDLDYLTGHLSESTHDMNFICDFTGLSAEAVNRLQALKNYERNEAINRLVSAEGFVYLIEKFSRFLSLVDSMESLEITRQVRDADKILSTGIQLGNDVLISADEAAVLYIGTVSNAITRICEEEFNKTVKTKKLKFEASDIDTMIQRIKTQVEKLNEFASCLEEQKREDETERQLEKAVSAYYEEKQLRETETNNKVDGGSDDGQH